MKSYSPRIGRRARSRIFSRLALDSSSISIGARSMMDVTMCSRSLIRSMHSLTGTPSFLRTSTIVLFTSSGSRPTLIVRLAWLSRSIKRTRFPFAARATPRLCVVVVFATPPF